MKRLIALLALVAATLSAEAQESFSFSKTDDYTFGKITKEDLLKNDYPIDSSADAVVLDDTALVHPQELNVMERLERAVYLGLDRQGIRAKYAAGAQIVL